MWQRHDAWAFISRNYAHLNWLRIDWRHKECEQNAYLPEKEKTNKQTTNKYFTSTRNDPIKKQTDSSRCWWLKQQLRIFINRKKNDATRDEWRDLSAYFVHIFTMAMPRDCIWRTNRSLKPFCRKLRYQSNARSVWIHLHLVVNQKFIIFGGWILYVLLLWHY